MVKQAENVKRNTFENLEPPDFVWKSGEFIPWDKAKCFGSVFTDY